jgi:hypothetical protein
LISSKVALDAIFAYADKRYHGLADRLSHTILGKQSNISDLLGAAAGEIASPLTGTPDHPGPYSTGLDQLAAWLQKDSTKRELHEIGTEILRTSQAVEPLVIGASKLTATLIAIGGLPIIRTVQALGPEFKLLGDGMGFAADHSRELAIAGWTLSGPFWVFEKTIESVNNAVGHLTGLWDWLAKHTDVALHINYSGPGSRELGWIGSAVGFLGGAGSLAKGLTGAIPSLGPLVRVGAASGGTAIDEGWSWVGEHGPELRWLPKHASIVPLDRAPGSDTGAMREMATAIHALASRPIKIEIDGHELWSVWTEEYEKAIARR